MVDVEAAMHHAIPRHLPRPLLAAALAVVAGCGCNRQPDEVYASLDAPLWDATSVVGVHGGLYVLLPAARGLAFVQTTGEATLVDLGDAAPGALSASPDGDTVASFTTRYTCPEAAEDDCAEDAAEVHTELAVLRAGAITQTLELASRYNALRWSPDGRFLVAFLDADGGGLDEVGVTVPVGFAATDVLFDDGAARALVLSQSEVGVLDLTTSPPASLVTFGLTLDADQVVVPVGSGLTPDGAHALISVEGEDALYVLDLDNPSVNITTLSGSPGAMAVNDAFDRTVLVYAGRPVVDVIDHDGFGVETAALDEPMSELLQHDDTVLLYSGRGKQDVYILRFSDKGDGVRQDLVELRLQDGAFSVHLAPNGEHAIALTATGYLGDRYGMEVVDLRPGREQTFPYALEGQGIGLAFSDTGDSTVALLLQLDVDYLYRLDLDTAAADQIDLAAPPLSIGALPSGEFYITHDVTSGLVTFLDPATDALTEVAGFALLDLLELSVSDTAEEAL